MNDNPAHFKSSMLHPKYWTSWFFMFLWWLLSQLPLLWLIFLGKQLGSLLYKINTSRVKIARKNLQICYPELSSKKLEVFVKRNLQETAIGIFESGAAWFWPDSRFRSKFTIVGQEYLINALTNKTGVLFLGVHFTTIEICAAMVNLTFPISGFYRPHKNKVYEFIQANRRICRNKKSTVIRNNDIRGIVKSLKQGMIINYAPDQDYGKERSVFAPFFNISTATVKAPYKLSSAGQAEVIPWTTKRDPITHHYTIEIHPSITQHLGRDETANATIINSFIEAKVKDNTEQYLWVHKRFKTRPNKEPNLYK